MRMRHSSLFAFCLPLSLRQIHSDESSLPLELSSVRQSRCELKNIHLVALCFISYKIKWRRLADNPESIFFRRSNRWRHLSCKTYCSSKSDSCNLLHKP